MAVVVMAVVATVVVATVVVATVVIVVMVVMVFDHITIDTLIIMDINRFTINYSYLYNKVKQHTKKCKFNLHFFVCF
ncbi:MAG: hypothetical protein A2Y22_03630 [Clostridiales bacterium GWD2_32_59]|nr:MAG: hypothetical protein A2Y22_03630 [Clostridiales bacterium GWD2_32_59]